MHGLVDWKCTLRPAKLARPSIDCFLKGDRLALSDYVHAILRLRRPRKLCLMGLYQPQKPQTKAVVTRLTSKDGDEYPKN